MNVNSDVVVDCNSNIRQQISASLLPIGTLSKTGQAIANASAGNKIMFAPGYLSGTFTSSVDIFDITTNSWSTAKLSQPRAGVATAVLGYTIFFRGRGNGNPSSRVDIYDAATNTWTTTELSEARGSICSATAGKKVLFAGGTNGFFKYSTTVGHI
ncbi:MAG: hypothetical protein ACR2KZ_19060 [Segetibacter sp.]